MAYDKLIFIPQMAGGIIPIVYEKLRKQYEPSFEMDYDMSDYSVPAPKEMMDQLIQFGKTPYDAPEEIQKTFFKMYPKEIVMNGDKLLEKIHGKQRQRKKNNM